MNCDLTETPLGNGNSRYTCSRCNVTGEWPSGHVKAKRMCRQRGPTGPGTCLARLLKEIGVEMTGDCQCFRRASAMDANGIAWCRENKTIIVGWLKEAASESNWSTVFAAGGKLLFSGWWSPLDPFGSIVAESLRRAESSTPS